MESDLDLAFRLQMEEAIAASLSLLPSSSSSAASSSRLQPPANSDSVYKFDELEAVVRDKIEQERRDREMSESEARRMRLDLSRRILDQKFAQGLIEIPDEDWEEVGDDVTMSLNEGSSTGTLPNYETYRGLLKYWPITNSSKEVMFLSEWEEILEATQPPEFQRCVVLLFQQIVRCLISPHFQTLNYTKSVC